MMFKDLMRKLFPRPSDISGKKEDHCRICGKVLPEESLHDVLFKVESMDPNYRD